MKLLKYLVIVSFITLWSLPAISNVSAQNIEPYKLLAPIPLNGDINNAPPPDQSTTLEEYLPAIIKLVIGLAGVLAVVMIIYGGLNIMTGGDNASTRDNAKKIIQNALSGLLLIITAWLILNTISPGLVKFNLKFEALNIGSGELSTDLGSDRGETEPGAGCVDCVELTAPHTIGKACSVEPCFVTSALNNRLKLLNSSLRDSINKGIEVTEAFPPTRNHADPCHRAGTCVDARFADRSENPNDLKAFEDLASKVYLTAQYEVTSIAKMEELKKVVPVVLAPRISKVCDDGVTPSTAKDGRYTDCCPKNLINDKNDKLCSWITGNHFSIYVKS